MEDGGACNETELIMGMHTGTHIDAPFHFLKNGGKVENLELDTFVGSAYVAHLPDIDAVQREHLEAANIPAGTKRLLIRTKNSALWQKKVNTFQEDYVGLTTDAAKWIAEQGIQLIGIDYLSVAVFSDILEVHQVLLSKEIVLLEGIDLSKVGPGEYKLICLPLRVMDADGAPVRAVLLDSNTKTV